MGIYNMNDLIRAYDRYAEERDQIGLDDRKRLHVQEANRVFNENGAKSILEVGSGPGNAAKLFLDEGFEIECVDFSPKMIDLVKGKGIVGHLLDCRDVERIGRAFDGVFSVNCLLHIPRAELIHVLQSIRNVMNIGGLFVLGLWGGQDFEGVLENNRYEPARFFVLHSQHTLLDILPRVFQIEEYRRTPFGEGQFFHKAVLRKTA